MKRRHFLDAMAVTASLGFVPALHAQVKDLNDAINKAGRQRMLSQRMAKCYMAMGQAVLPDVAERHLAASMALFDRQLAELKAFSPSADIRSTYTQLEAAWSDYKGTLVGSTPSKAGGEPVLAAAGKVLVLANQGTGQLEAASGKSVGKLVNIAGRQRMLSQRMGAYYLSASWGVQATRSTAEVTAARDEFVKAHDLLKKAPEANEAIRAELQLAESQFTFFEAALRNLKPGANETQAMANVFTTSERILQVMDGVTGMYSRLT
jgi:nitrate/nitrite-specific signal transduction histidine kinase